MVNPNPSFLSKRVKKSPQTGIRSDRYEFLGLDQAEPDLGDPLIGPSSVGANPYTGNISDLYVIASAGSGERYWTKQTSLIAGGVVTPGSITVRDEGAVVGGVSQITDVNFVGSGVTIRNPASWIGAGSSSVDVEITVTDVAVSGQIGAVPYKASSGFLLGADEFVYDDGNNFVGIGSTVPKVELDVLGDVNVSGAATVGIFTANTGAFLDSLKVGNFEISDNTTFVQITSGNVGIGTTLPKATLDVFGDTIITGITTITSVVSTSSSTDFLYAGIATVGFITATDGFVGFITATEGNIGILTANILTITSGVINNLSVIGAAITVTGNLQVDDDTLYVDSATNSVGIGTIDPVQKLQIGVSTNSVVITDDARVGIATTNPKYNLEVDGAIGFTGKLFVNGDSGTSGQVLLSGGIGNPSWGAPGAVTVGAANSVGIANTTLSELFFPTFTRETENNALLKVDTDGISYNPGLNYFGIGTSDLNYTLTLNGSLGINTNALYVSESTNRVGVGTTVPTSTLTVNGDVSVSDNISVGTTVNIGQNSEVALSVGIITTTDVTADQVLSVFDTNSYRSTKYNVQVTCTGQLVGSASSSSNKSVSNLQSGTLYAAGSYKNVSLTTVSGTGNDARANIEISPEFSLTIDSISNGSFNTSDDTSTISVNSPVLFNRAIPATPAQNSRVTSITVNNIGSGYTSVPTVTIDDPTNDPTIPGVTGIGSTATAEVSNMVVTDVTIDNAATHSVVPTIKFNTPVGIGVSAEGVVGFGISTIAITNSGSGYNPIPTPGISGGFSLTPATIEISEVAVTSIEFTNTGTGYNSGNFPILTFSSPEVGADTATAVVDTLGISTIFTITTGVGYTRPPILTVGSPDVGINTAEIVSTLGVSTVTITSPGTGYTSSPILALSPTVTGFAATVGLGVTSDNIVVNGGSGYGGLPTVTFDPPDVGSDTAAGNFTGLGAGGVLEDFVITNQGSGYFSIPSVSISGGGGIGAAVDISQMAVTDVTINNTGLGATRVPTAQIVSSVGAGAGASVSMGIGNVNVIGFGTGYDNAPGVTVTPIDGVTGTGGAVVAGLGITFDNVTITNPGTGYSSIPTVTVSSPVGVASTSIGEVGVSIEDIRITNPGIGYSQSIPNVTFNEGTDNPGSGAAADVNTIFTTNVYVNNSGFGYTATDLAATPIVTFVPFGTPQWTVGFGVSEVSLTNLGIGYTTQSSAVVTISDPEVSTGTTATATAALGYPGILPGPGVNTTGSTQIYYVASAGANSIGISTGVGIGTLTGTDVGDDLFLSDQPAASVGGEVSNVFVVSPGSGYTSTSQITAVNFDGANIGSGFTFTSSVVVDNYQFSDVMVLQSVGSAYTSCDFIEFGTLANNEILGSFNADIDSENARLLFTPTYRNNTIKISSNSISK